MSAFGGWGPVTRNLACVVISPGIAVARRGAGCQGVVRVVFWVMFWLVADRTARGNDTIWRGRRDSAPRNVREHVLTIKVACFRPLSHDLAFTTRPH